MKMLYISLTNKCNRACDWCPVTKWRNKPEFEHVMPLDKLTAFIEKYAPTHVELTGGEPLLYPYYKELCQWLIEHKIYFITKTNGDLYEGYNMASAWHGGMDDFPKHYDIIILIDPMPGIHEKYKYCMDNSIPFVVIDEGPHSGRYYISPNLEFKGAPSLFICNDGHVKWCHSRELNSWERDSKLETNPENTIYSGKEFNACTICYECKQGEDFAICYDKMFFPETSYEYLRPGEVREASRMT